ncbi:MAG: hypothetical protein ACYTGW_04600 [Planctomycetota bacterium]|jgi:hypothetical protein
MVLALVTMLGLLCAAVAAQGARTQDPVVIVGASLPGLLGKDPHTIVAFRYDKGWQQIPVQVDERTLVPVSQIRKNNKLTTKVLVYADPNTFTGADPDNKFDADDELCFMARDAGGPAGFGDPAGVVAGSRQGLTVIDPVSNSKSHVYLFLSQGSLRPDAGKDYVKYTYNLKSGAYKTTYRLSGTNPEDSPVVTSDYEAHFSDRWILDGLKIKTGAATGVDILDRSKFQFVPGSCKRTTDTFSAGGGAMIANIDGPVRAIRSVVGANSGSTTSRDWICYQGRLDMITWLRVHAIQATWWFMDYSPAASGMTYYDDLNTKGVTIDGKPDTVNFGKLTWQLVAGKQGSLTHSIFRATDITRIVDSSFYDDSIRPTWNQCTGDGFAYGASGPTTGGLPNTDPLRGPANNYVASWVLYMDAPGVTMQQAVQKAAAAARPFTVRTIPGFRLFGQGCRGTAGTPILDMAGVPEIDSPLTLRVRNLPKQQPGLLQIGLSDKRWGSFPLPLDMAIFGMPGCTQYIGPVLEVLLQSSTNGDLQLQARLPNDKNLIGAKTFLQHLSVDPGANAANLINTNAVEISIGG